MTAELRARLPAPTLDVVQVQVFGFGRDHTAGRAPLSPPVREATAGFWRSVFLGLGAAGVSIGADLPE